MSVQLVRHGTCVLTFHRVVHHVQRDHDVGIDSFRSLLDQINTSGREVESDLTAHPTAGASVVLTFDDGTTDHAYAAELLEDRGMRGVFFISTARLDRSGYLSRAAVVALDDAGHSIGAHAHSHRPLSGLSGSEVVDEVRRSAEGLGELLGHPVDVFAPPGGLSHPRLQDAFVTYGISASRSMRWGVYEHWNDRWKIPCVPVTEVALGRGWVQSSVEALRLPRAMQAVNVARRALPLSARVSLRSTIHARRRDRRR